MMKHFFSVAIILLIGIITSCQGRNSDPTNETCSYFHTGTFKYLGSEDIRIERTKTQQIEYNLNGEGGYIYTDYYSVTWVNDCEYYLTLDSTDHAGDLAFTKNDTMWVKINSILRTGYSFIAVKGQETFQGELKKTAS